MVDKCRGHFRLLGESHDPERACSALPPSTPTIGARCLQETLTSPAEQQAISSLWHCSAALSSRSGSQSSKGPFKQSDVGVPKASRSATAWSHPEQAFRPAAQKRRPQRTHEISGVSYPTWSCAGTMALSSKLPTGRPGAVGGKQGLRPLGTETEA